MSIASWLFTLALHAVILTTIFRRKWQLIIFPITLLVVLAEAIFLAQFYAKFGIRSPYYYQLVMFFDIFNILPYMACISEAWKKHINFLVITMGLFLFVKFGVLGAGLYSFDYWKAGKIVLQWANTACVIIWTGAFLALPPRKDVNA